MKLRPVDWILFGAYCVLTALLVTHHEPWRDEADSWLASRDISLTGIFAHARYMGTPCLWYLLQMPLAKAGLPYEVQAGLNLLISVAAIFVFLRFVRFPPTIPAGLQLATKALVIFSYYAAYEYAVIARSYALTMLLLFSCAALHGVRHQRPVIFSLVIALLMNTSAHGLVLGFLILARNGLDVVTGTRERGWSAGMIIGLLGAVIAVAQLIPPHDRQHVASTLTQNGAWEAAFHAFGNAIIPTRRIMTPSLAEAGYALNGLAILLSAVMISRRPRPLFFYLAALAAFLGLFAFVHYGGIRHAGFLLMVTIYFALWTTSDETDAAPCRVPITTFAIVALALLGSALVTVKVARLELRTAYSDAREAAAFINRNGFTHQPIAAFPDVVCTAVLPYLEQRAMWYLGRQENGSFTTWDQTMIENRRLPVETVTDRIKTFVERNGTDVLILLNFPLPDNASTYLEMIYATTGTPFNAQDERFFLYRPLTNRTAAHP